MLTSETPACPHSVFPQPVRPKHPYLLNFLLTQFLFFYSLLVFPSHEEGPDLSTGSTPQSVWAWVGQEEKARD